MLNGRLLIIRKAEGIIKPVVSNSDPALHLVASEDRKPTLKVSL
jgi:hypothetical protein